MGTNRPKFLILRLRNINGLNVVNFETLYIGTCQYDLIATPSWRILQITPSLSVIWGLYCVQGEVSCHMRCTAVQFGRYGFYHKYRVHFPKTLVSSSQVTRCDIPDGSTYMFKMFVYSVYITGKSAKSANWKCDKWKPSVLRWVSLCNLVFLIYRYLFSVLRLMRSVRIVAKIASYLRHIRLSVRRSVYISAAPTGPIYRQIWYWGLSLKNCRGDLIFFKPCKNIGHFCEDLISFYCCQ